MSIETNKENIPPPVTKANRMRHVEGLRGIAILSVVLFHYFKAFPNGYYGVDIFLVISGSLPSHSAPLPERYGTAVNLLMK